MFGYIKPLEAELKVKEYDFYKAVYCGLCRALKGSVGCLAEMTLSYDFVFLALLGLSWNGDEIKLETRRCAVHPLRRRPMLVLNPTLERTASASALLFYHKIKDDLRDSRGIKRLPAVAALPIASAMRRAALSPGGPDGIISDCLGEMHALEDAASPSPDASAELFGKLLAAVFASVTDGEREKRLAYAAGMSCGRWIYLADALDDAEKDRKSSSYNPFNLSSLPSRETAETALTSCLYGLETSVNLTDFADSGIESIIKNIIYLGMPFVSSRIADKMAEKAESAPPDKHNNG